MAVSKKSRALYWRVFDGMETSCANFINRFQERRLLKKYITKKPIPADFKREYKKYWSQYAPAKIVRGGYASHGIMPLRMRFMTQGISQIL